MQPGVNHPPEDPAETNGLSALLNKVAYNTVTVSALLNEVGL